VAIWITNLHTDPDPVGIVTLVKRALAAVSTVQVLLVRLFACLFISTITQTVVGGFLMKFDVWLKMAACKNRRPS